MRYKVGDEVVLRGDFNLLGLGKTVKVGDIRDGVYWSEEVLRGYFYHDDIDHEKTAELQTDRVVKHYTNELEKIVAEKNKVDIPVDNIKPSHYRKGEIDLIESWYQTMPFDGFRWAMKSHIMKYVYRFEEKNGVEDLDKATYYIERLKEKELEQC